MIYIAGPYSAPTAHQVEANIRAAERVAVDLTVGGQHWMCPHTMTRFMHDLTASEDYWIRLTGRMQKACDCVILTVPLGAAVYSHGTRDELERAMELGQPVYENVVAYIASMPLHPDVITLELEEYEGYKVGRLTAPA